MDLTTVIAWIVLGAVAGWLANIVVNKGSGSLVTNIIVGIVGAFLGGWLFSQFGSGAEATGFNGMSVLVSFVGAVVLLLILKVLNK